MLEIDDLTVCFKFFPGSYNILIFSDLGKIPQKGRVDFYKMLLEANHALFKTAGATLSVYTPLDMVALQYLCNAQNTDAQRFITIVENFVATAKFWKKECKHAPVSDRIEKVTEDFNQNYLIPV